MFIFYFFRGRMYSYMQILRNLTRKLRVQNIFSM